MGKGFFERDDDAVLLDAHAPLVPSVFAQEFTRESSAIEGLPIPPEHLGRPWAAQEGHLMLYRTVVELANTTEPLTERDIRMWQAVLVQEQPSFGGNRLHDDDVGAYRRRQVSARGRECAPAYTIAASMADLLAQMNQATGLTGEVATRFVAQTHLAYEQLHPFIDGNGRSGRLVALWLLLRLGVSPVLFTAADRFKTYYECFDGEGAADKMGDYFISHQRHDVKTEDLL